MAVLRFLNVSNHPSRGWSEEQLEAARKGGAEICDIPFPEVPPSSSEREVENLALSLFRTITDKGEPWSYEREEQGGYLVTGIHLMGEAGLVCSLIPALVRLGYRVVYSTTERRVVEKNGVKTSFFRFVRFREYKPEGLLARLAREEAGREFQEYLSTVDALPIGDHRDNN